MGSLYLKTIPPSNAFFLVIPAKDQSIPHGTARPSYPTDFEFRRNDEK
jgi:hypothetical protein